MLLGIDIGNTNIVIACFDGDTIVKKFRINTDKNKSLDEYIILINDLFFLENIDKSKFKGSIISCVVPKILNIIDNAIYKIINIKSMIVNKNLNMDLTIVIDEPSKLGCDLISNAVGAISLYKNSPFIIIDMGTATTISVIDENKNYIGGLIMPGLNISLDALSNMASLLPSIKLSKPKSIIGTNTIDCMQSGIIYGAASMVDGIVNKIKNKIGKNAKVIATGGLSYLVVEFCENEIIHNKDLMMYGLMELYKLNKNI